MKILLKMLEELLQSYFYFSKLVLVKLNNSILNMKHFDSSFPTAAKKHLKTTFELSLHEANF